MNNSDDGSLTDVVNRANEVANNARNLCSWDSVGSAAKTVESIASSFSQQDDRKSLTKGSKSAAKSAMKIRDEILSQKDRTNSTCAAALAVECAALAVREAIDGKLSENLEVRINGNQLDVYSFHKNHAENWQSRAEDHLDQASQAQSA